jgi:transposase
MDGIPFDETDATRCPDCNAVMEWFHAAFICPECGLMLAFDGDAVVSRRAEVVSPAAVPHVVVCHYCGASDTCHLRRPPEWFLCAACGKENHSHIGSQ